MHVPLWSYAHTPMKWSGRMTRLNNTYWLTAANKLTSLNHRLDGLKGRVVCAVIHRDDAAIHNPPCMGDDTVCGCQDNRADGKV